MRHLFVRWILRLIDVGELATRVCRRCRTCGLFETPVQRCMACSSTERLTTPVDTTVIMAASNVGGRRIEQEVDDGRLTRRVPVVVCWPVWPYVRAVTSVAVLGGGVGGLSAAHELVAAIRFLWDFALRLGIPPPELALFAERLLTFRSDAASPICVRRCLRGRHPTRNRCGTRCQGSGSSRWTRWVG